MAGVRQGYRVVRAPEDLAAEWRELRRRFAARESSDLARVAAVAALVGDDGCLVRRLLRYFGEELGRDCGHCGPCAGNAPSKLIRARSPVVVSGEELNALRGEHPRALSGARPMTRFLCGIASPAISAAKLTRHARFGALVEAPFAEVLERVSAATA